MCEKNHDFLAVQHVVFHTKHEVMLGRKRERKHFGLAAKTASHSFIHSAVLPTHTGPCRRLVLLSNGPVQLVCVCSRPACCVCNLHQHHGTISATQPESGTAEAAFTLSLLDLFVEFHSAKTTAQLFYLVEKFR